MSQELKQKIHAEAKAFLATKNLPNGDSNTIIQELPNLWKHLESKGLLKTFVDKGFGYAQFVRIALQERQKADMIKAYSKKFGFRFK